MKRKTKNKKSGKKEKKGITQFVKKFHRFLDAWNRHVKDEIQIHKSLLYGNRSFAKHLKDARRIHEKLLKNLKRL